MISCRQVDWALANMAGVIDEEGAADLRSLVQEQGRLSFSGFAEWALRQPTFDLMANHRELFALVDSDANGYHSHEEIGLILQLLDGRSSPEGIRAFIAQHDRDGTGTITHEELI